MSFPISLARPRRRSWREIGVAILERGAVGRQIILMDHNLRDLEGVRLRGLREVFDT